MDPLLFQFLTGLTLGLPTSLHCVGMCGGIMGALGLTLPSEARGSARGFSVHAGLLNLERIFTYSAAGGLAGLGGLGMIAALEQSNGYFLLRALAGMTLLFVGFSLLGIAGFSEALNRIMAPMARPLARLGALLNRMGGLSGALAKGMVWGFLPCGLVYSALVYSALSGGPWRGAAVMAGFGLGTVPALIATAFGVNYLTRLGQRIWLSRLAGVVIIGFAVATYMGMDVQVGELVCRPPE